MPRKINLKGVVNKVTVKWFDKRSLKHLYNTTNELCNAVLFYFQGKYFMCESTQVAALDPLQPPQILFNNFVPGEPLQLVYPPMLDVIRCQFHTQKLWICETMLSIVFSNVRNYFYHIYFMYISGLAWKLWFFLVSYNFTYFIIII